MRKIFIFILSFLPVNLCFAQKHETVKSKEISGIPDKSYIVNDYGRLLPSTTISGSSGPFFLKANLSGFQDNNKNFVRTESILKKDVTTDVAITGLAIADKSTSIIYVDGIGRSLQDVSVKASPSQNDLVKFYVYDAFGRQAKTYLPYSAANTSNSFRNDPVTEQATFYLNPPTGVAQETARPFSEQVFEASPLNRVTKAYGAGNDWFNQQRFAETETLINTANDNVLEWVYNGPNPPTLGTPNPPSLNGFYAANLLVVSQTVDEEGLIKKTFTNFLGQTVLERVEKGTDVYDTYNIYDWEGNLFCVIPPEGSIKAAYFDTQTSTQYFPYRDAMTAAQRQAFLNDWAFQHDYDDYQRLIGKRVPGSDWEFMVYDPWDRLVLSQDGKLRASNKWIFTKYDEFNRVIMSGFYPSSSSRSTLQGDINTHYATNPLQKRFEVRDNTNATGYTQNKSFPLSPSESNLLTVTYYDDHAFVSYPGWDAEGKNYAYVLENNLPASSALPVTLKGHATGGKTRIVDGTQWLNSVTYYDKKYNAIQVISENHLNGTDRVSSEIDFAGRTKSTLRTHATRAGSFTLLQQNTFDHAGRLLKTKHILDGQEVTLLAQNYNELGQLVEKNLHSTDAGASYLQSIDYRYNIRGWITNINNVSLSVDGANNDSNDLFGMEIFYNAAAPAVNGVTPTALYNGNISAIKWKSTNLIDPAKEKIFRFNYDFLSRLQGSYYATKNTTNYDGDAGFFDSNFGYDRNGNLASLQRYGKIGSTRTQIDDLRYGYSAGNRLKFVEDNIETADKFGVKGYGFTEKSDYPGTPEGSIPTEYLYDENGNVKGDMNKGVDVIYNHLDMPAIITFENGDRIEYTYDASGNKIKQKVFKGSSLIAERDYIGGAHYENGALAFLTNSEGRAIKDGNKWFYEYQLRDHQNNTMVSFGALEQSTVYKASMETSPATTATYEESTFKNIANRRDNLFNNTKPTADAPNPAYSAWTNGSMGREIGPGLKLEQVNTGDRLKMEVYARYVVPGSGPNADVVGGLVDLVATGTFGIASGETAYNGFNNYLPGAASAVTANSSSPKAYINYIIFNNTYTAYQFGWKAVSSSAAGAFEKLSVEVTVPSGYSNGYAYIYVTNESNYNTYFDDLYVLHEKTATALQVTQLSDYYPFGLSFNTYVKESVSANRYLYQAQESQDDLSYDEYQYKFRMHDPGMGRFLGVDPLSEKFMYNSTYAFAENRVIDGIELEGAEWQVSPMHAGFMGMNSNNWDGGWLTGTWDYGSFMARGFANSVSNWLTTPWTNWAQGGQSLYQNTFEYKQNLQNPYIPEEVSSQIKTVKDWQATGQAGLGATGIGNQALTLTGIGLGGVQSTFGFNAMSRGFSLGGSRALNASDVQILNKFEANAARGVNPSSLIRTEVGRTWTTSTRNVAEIMNSAKTQGILKPVDVFVHNGKSYIINGHHRVQAAMRLGQNVPVNYLSSPGNYSNIFELQNAAYKASLSPFKVDGRMLNSLLK